MKSQLYILQCTIKNQLRRMVKKPSILISSILIICYLIFLAVILINTMIQSKANTPQMLALGCSGIILLLGPMNYITYAKRKGLLFTVSDVHFVFPAPIAPKKVLLVAHGKTILIEVFMAILTYLLGVFLFGVSPLTMFFCILIMSVVDGVLQASIVVLLYGNEKFSYRVNNYIAKALLILLGALGIVIFYSLYQNGFTIQAILGLCDNKLIQFIPIFGWELAAIQMILVAPTTFNIFCTMLLIITTLIFFVLAFKMKCTGQFYEDAIKFAEDYQIVKAKSKKGEAAIIGKKKKFLKASIQYKGKGAKSIFYRQLLEYKKNPLFIFGVTSLFYPILGIGFGVLYNLNELKVSPVLLPYMAPLILMYLTLVFSGMQTKWERELESPYTFLLPDTPMKKIWYATNMEHIRSFIHGLLLAIPVVIMLKLPIWYVLIYALVNMALYGIELYARTVCQVIFGSGMGKTLKNILKTLITWTAISIVIPIILLVRVVVGTELSLVVGTLYLLFLAAILMMISSKSFYKMEISA